jgi:transposase
MREEWREFQKTVPTERLIFLDETGVKTNMTRLYGRSPKGTRCYDSAPTARWKSITVLSAIRHDGSTASIMFDGAVDRRMFDSYVENLLAPILKPGDILVLDNLGAHKSQVSQKLVESMSADYKFLPAYSPDLNPIEKMWSKLKQVLRGLKARTPSELYAAVGKALDMVTADDAQGWFRSCGYGGFQS